MNPSRYSSPPGAGLWTCVLSLVIFLLGLGAPAASAANAAPARPVVATVTAPKIQPERSGWSWRKLYSPLEGVLGNRTRMIQFAMLAMMLALYIIWWRK